MRQLKERFDEFQYWKQLGNTMMQARENLEVFAMRQRLCLRVIEPYHSANHRIDIAMKAW